MSESASRFRLVRDLSLRGQLGVGFGVLIVLTLVAGIASYWGQQRSADAVGTLLAVDGRIAELSLRSNAAMLKARRAEKDFLLFQREYGFREARSRYTTLIRASYAEIRRHMAEVLSLRNSPDLIQQTEAIEQAIGQYEAGFLKVVELHGQLGFVDTGAEGQLRKKAHELEAMLGPASLDRLMVDLLSLRRSEKDFVMRSQDKYVEAFENGFDRFTSDLAGSSLPAGRKGRMLSLATEYSALFHRYVQLAAQIDSEQEAYLAAAHTVEPALESLYANASRAAIATRDDAQKATRTTGRTIVAATLVAALLGLAVARMVSRGVSRSVDGAVGFASRVAQGDLTARLALTGRNEFSVLVGALNQMTQALQSSRSCLEQRAAELAQSNEALREEIKLRQEAQAQLVLTEKMAALGELVAGVAHEINTPVGIVVTSASVLARDTQRVRRSYERTELSEEELQDYLATAGQSAQLIGTNAARAADLIQSFKQVAVDQTAGEQRQVNLRHYISETLVSLTPVLKAKAAVAEVVGADDIVINAFPGVLSQILTNLVINSLTHGFDEGTAGRIRIAVKAQDERIVLTYADNGKGIPFEIRHRIFEPFFTTRRNAGGSGLGLHILYNLVTRTLGGSVRLDESASGGVLFVIEFPIPADTSVPSSSAWAGESA